MAAAAKSPTTPGPSERTPAPNDFMTGYTLGLIGGVRSWMTKSRRNLRDSRPASDDESEESDSKSNDRGRPVASAS
ncbi:hypothetical protein O1611_g10613 [Lasiodiplodia mahajangana]|uniref:Uncharacterized protein n=1 Tax=Lasiodiplodia mahajangana TaxID=1108764 RepID=A0ACC2IW94_9PEZI|nr:hypothetical protein O1611_g10613 [Lasiodiplodia mahajangana]